MVHSWTRPKLYQLPPSTGSFSLKDTQSGVEFEPFKNHKFDLYVCGITPYDAAHIGHLFTYLIFDTIVRVALDLGVPVTYVENITDIDDPLFEKARKDGKSWSEIALPQIDLFKDAMEKMRVIPPTHLLSVTESISQIVNAVEKSKDFTYRLDQSVYFKSNQEKLLSFTGKSPAELYNISKQRGGDPDTPGKFEKLDPKIWLQSAHDEPSWNSIFGEGRPGWHIECVAIANSIFESTFDLQGGGKDLLFPHHAFCDQINEEIFGYPLANGYLHVELVGYQGEKMSKSLGNLVFVQELFERGYTVNEIRLALLSQNWTNYWEFEFNLMEIAKHRLQGWEAAVSDGFFPGIGVVRSIFKNHLYKNLDIATTLNEIDLAIAQQIYNKESSESLKLISNLFGIELPGLSDNE
jgi:L-cysteine:1D-myo-inositol 2-amino-2-deoxy-alpha-D-glucopyranoside ligase